MRTTWNNGMRLLCVAVFLFVCLLAPVRTVARGGLEDEVLPACVQWQFGEPGHDPFSRGGDPGGNEEHNGSGGNGEGGNPPGSDQYLTDQIPLEGNGCCYEQGFLDSCRETILRLYRSFI